MPQLAQIATAKQAQLQDGRRMGFVQHGDPAGQPVLFFHDLWSNRNQRHPDDGILMRAGIRLIGVDRPGYGMSTRKPGRSLMDVVDDVMLLSKALQLDRFAVLGFSAGGPYAIACAYRFPQVVQRCVLVSCLPPLDHARGFQALHPVYARIFQLASGQEMLLRSLLRGFFWLDGQRSAAHSPRELGNLLGKSDQAVLSQPQVQAARRDMWEDLRRNSSDSLADELRSLTQPWGFSLQSIRSVTRVWWGEDDRFCAPIVGQRIADFVPNASAEKLPGAGHFLLYSHWEAILQSLRSPS